jgi:predicted ATPase
MGISQVIPILVATSALSSKMICMEQPELHLHPGLQAKLADALFESAISKDNKLIIETHSEHLILRILRRIRETTRGKIGTWPAQLREACPNGIMPEDVAVLYVEPGAEGAKVRELRIDGQGRFIDEWPNGFFEERFSEEF